MPNNDGKKVKDQPTTFKELEELNNQSSNMLYGVSQDFIDKSNNEINKIKDTISRVSIRNSFITGSNPIDFLTKMAYDSRQTNSPLSKLPKDKNGKINLNKFMNGITLGQINEIYAQEMDRISTYDDYRAITRYIPQISQAINVWRDEIISPDDFTKDIFDIVYDDANNKDLANKVERNITEILNPKYTIEDRVDNWISNTLILGDQFIAVLKLEEEFNKIFQEGSSYKILDESHILNEDAVEISESDINLLSELYTGKMKEKDKESFNEEDFSKHKKDFIKDIKNEVANIINSNIKYSTNPMTLLEDEIPIIVDFQKEANTNKYSTLDSKKMNDALSGNGLYEKKVGNNSVKAGYINGSYIKTLEPERTIKIKIGEVVYGYFYIEVRGKNELIHPKNIYSALTLRQTVDLTSSDTSRIDDPKVRLITDLFSKNIAQKIDKKFIADNKEFKKIIYELLQKEYIYNNNIQITYFEPDTVKHLMVKEGKDGYGISVLRDVLFTAKLYLSVLIATLLTKVSRAQDHRTFYIETGLSEDVEGIVNAFIRDVETKDVKLSDTQSIDTIFNTIGKLEPI